MKIALLDYGARNSRSVANALRHLGVDHQATADPEEVLRADKILFPGAGAADVCMKRLAETGLDDALRSCERPVLAIALGMQLLAASSDESAEAVDCLDVLPGHAARFEGAVKLPQIGWNTVDLQRDDPLFTEIPTATHFYFLHEARLHTDPELVLAETDYGGAYPSAVLYENYRGVQFHPERSGRAGLRLLTNFIERC